MGTLRLPGSRGCRRTESGRTCGWHRPACRVGAGVAQQPWHRVPPTQASARPGSPARPRERGPRGARRPGTARQPGAQDPHPAFPQALAAPTARLPGSPRTPGPPWGHQAPGAARSCSRDLPGRESESRRPGRADPQAAERPRGESLRTPPPRRGARPRAPARLPTRQPRAPRTPGPRLSQGGAEREAARRGSSRTRARDQGQPPPRPLRPARPGVSPRPRRPRSPRRLGARPAQNPPLPPGPQAPGPGETPPPRALTLLRGGTCHPEP